MPSKAAKIGSWLRNSKYLSVAMDPSVISFLLTMVVMTSYCLVFEPRWETNDDVQMSMRANGYGAFAQGSPHLIYSNVIWGYIVRLIPEVHGVLGYSLATIAVLFVVTWSILYFLPRLGVWRLAAFLAAILVISRPTLFPQFTINAGLLAIAAVIALVAYSRKPNIGSLIVACLLAYCGYLIRKEEFFLLVAVALPFLPWEVIRKSGQAKICLLILGATIAVSAIIDQHAYSGPEWQHFTELNEARRPYTDFGVAEALIKRPEIADRHGFSRNDLLLIRYWFFVDPNIADPQELNSMSAELGPLTTMSYGFREGLFAIKQLAAPSLLPILIAGLIIGVLFFRWPLALAWGICLVAVFTMGYVGRPAIFRVYIPLLSFLVLVPLFLCDRDSIKRWITAFTLLIAGAWNLSLLSDAQTSSSLIVDRVRSDLKELPETAHPLVTWASSFPYEYAYPVFDGDSTIRRIHFYSLSLSTFSPNSVAVAEEHKGNGLITLLNSDEGINIVGSPNNNLGKLLNLLGGYCQEHYGKHLITNIKYRKPTLAVVHEKCSADE